MIIFWAVLISFLVLWLVGMFVVVFHNDLHPFATENLFYAWLFFWPVMILVKLIHAIKLGYKETQKIWSNEMGKT